MSKASTLPRGISRTWVVSNPDWVQSLRCARNVLFTPSVRAGAVLSSLANGLERMRRLPSTAVENKTMKERTPHVVLYAFAAGRGNPRLDQVPGAPGRAGRRRLPERDGAGTAAAAATRRASVAESDHARRDLAVRTRPAGRGARTGSRPGAVDPQSP